GPLLVDDSAFTTGALLQNYRLTLLTPALGTIRSTDAEAIRSATEPAAATDPHVPARPRTSRTSRTHVPHVAHHLSPAAPARPLARARKGPARRARLAPAAARARARRAGSRRSARGRAPPMLRALQNA
ncbi:hypothetical protein ACFV08_27420, partial [Streptomyces fradiae]